MESVVGVAESAPCSLMVMVFPPCGVEGVGVIGELAPPPPCGVEEGGHLGETPPVCS